MKTKKLTLCALFAAAAIAVNAAEGFLPVTAFLPPGARLGLSNVVTMFASVSLGLPYALAIALLKSLFVLASRGVTAFLMSLAGGLLSTLVCGLLLTRGKRRLGFVAVGMIGALIHNCAQTAVCVIWTGSAILWYLPFLALASLVSGAAGGFLLALTDRYFPKKLLKGTDI